jgi:hypothetical protein
LKKRVLRRKLDQIGEEQCKAKKNVMRFIVLLKKYCLDTEIKTMGPLDYARNLNHFECIGLV